MNTLRDDLQEQDLSNDQTEMLQNCGIIYYCLEHDCYHIDPDHTWNDVEMSL